MDRRPVAGDDADGDREPEPQGRDPRREVRREVRQAVDRQRDRARRGGRRPCPPPATAAPPRAGTGGGRPSGALPGPGAGRSPAVRSATATSMMFMITIPPTPSETEAIRRVRMKAAAEIWCQTSCRLSAVTMPNGSGARKSVWRSARSTARTSSAESSTPSTPALRLDQDVDRRAAAELLAEGLDRHVDHVVAALAERVPLLGEEADHPVGSAADQDRRGRSGRSAGRARP